MVKRIFQSLQLDKIAAVDRPCQEPALMTIMKRAGVFSPESDALQLFYKAKYSADDRKDMAASGEAMSDGSYPIKDADDLDKAIHAVGRGKNNSHAAIRAHIKRRAKAMGLTDKLPEEWTGSEVGKVLDEMLAKAGIDSTIAAETFAERFDDQLMLQKLWDDFWKAQGALQQSIESIVKDDAVSDKAAMIRQSVAEFSGYICQLIPNDITKSLAAGIAAATAGAPVQSSKGALMPNELKKALGLPETATDADVTKAVADLKKASEGKVEKMSDAHSGFMNHKDAKLPKGGKDAFQEMSSADRSKHVADNPIEEDSEDKVAKALKSGDAFKTPDGQVFQKRDFGNDVAFNFAKSQNATIVSQAADIAKRAETEAVSSFAKRATDIGQPVEFGATLRKAYQGDATAQGEVEKILGALQKQVAESNLFDSFGSSVVKAGSALEELNAKRDALMKAEPKLTQAQAFAKAYEDRANTDIVKRYKQEQRAAN